MAQIDSQLEDVDRYVFSLATANFDIHLLDSPNSEDDYQIAKHNILFYKSASIALSQIQSCPNTAIMPICSVKKRER
ncbi:hypothetical protein [Paenibacillus andongensis]|uniref:hypothetical protein n=1 Tax=Paenibacillus andongensis TaxID=2975482 RepID=UPI0021BB5F17|nr:hypothetical protein [Paenibacillus andongensis]